METTRNIISILILISLTTSIAILYFSIRNLKIKTAYNLTLFETIISAILVGLYLSMTNYSNWYYILVIIWIANIILAFRTCCSLKEIIEEMEEYDKIIKSLDEEDGILKFFESEDPLCIEMKNKILKNQIK